MDRRRRTRRRRAPAVPAPAAAGERGQAAVELALALPVVVLLLLGMLQVALVGRDQLAIELAAREAARAAAVSADPVAAARLAAERVTSLRPLQVAVSAGGDDGHGHRALPERDRRGDGRAPHRRRRPAGVGDDGRRAAVTAVAGTLARMDLRARHDVVGTVPVLALVGVGRPGDGAAAARRLVPARRRPRRAAAWRSTSTASTSSTTPALGVAARGGRARPSAAAATSWSWSSDQRPARRASRSTGFDRAVDVVDRLADGAHVLTTRVSRRHPECAVTECRGRSRIPTLRWRLRTGRRTGRRTWSPWSSRRPGRCRWRSG